MLRKIFFVIGLLVAQGCFAQAPDTSLPSARSEAQAERIWDVLLLDELMPIIRDEALAEASIMDETMLERGGDGRWIQIVDEIHDPVRMKELLKTALFETVNDASPQRIGEALTFYSESLGKKIVKLEISAEQVMLDKSVEEQAKAEFAAAAKRADPRAMQIIRMIAIADLFEPSVARGLNATFAFFKGVEAGGGNLMPMTEAQLLEEAWKQEPIIRDDVESWLAPFLYYAYSSLSDQELEQYIEFSVAPEGRALLHTVYAAFDKLYSQLAGEMGYAFAGQLQGQKL